MRSLWTLRRALLGATVLAMLLVAGPAVPAFAQDGAATPPPMLGGRDPSQPCAEGVLHLRDLEGADASFKKGMADATAKAVAWQSDARLFSLQLSCPLLEEGYSWNGVFFSESRQSFYRTDTLEQTAAEYEPAAIPTLDPSTLSFRNIYNSLLKAGLDGSMTIDPSNGVTVRQNSATIPFGPRNAPLDKVLVHLAIIDRNETKDVWIDVVDGTVYRYEV
ncbi:MAG: hypothetical protein WBA46_05725 [Thermomicrobiales bacterium]